MIAAEFLQKKINSTVADLTSPREIVQRRSKRFDSHPKIQAIQPFRQRLWTMLQLVKSSPKLIYPTPIVEQGRIRTTVESRMKAVELRKGLLGGEKWGEVVEREGKEGYKVGKIIETFINWKVLVRSCKS